jgi:hypothetical protein
MARIGKADHARILHMVDVERRKVADIATEYGCSPANIYTLLGKLRRLARDAEKLPETVPAPGALTEEVIDPPRHMAAAAATDLFASAAQRVELPAPTAIAGDRAGAPVAAQPAASTPDLPGPAKASDLRHKALPAKRGGVGAALAKPGYGLVMRTAEGDDGTTPFRSLDDLLSAVKPILRAAARSPDAVWFSIQQIDLSMVEYEST